MLEGIGSITIRRLFRMKYQKISPCSYSNRRWYAEYTARGPHERAGGSGRPQISNAIKKRDQKYF